MHRHYFDSDHASKLRTMNLARVVPGSYSGKLCIEKRGDAAPELQYQPGTGYLSRAVGCGSRVVLARRSWSEQVACRRERVTGDIAGGRTNGNEAVVYRMEDAVRLKRRLVDSEVQK